MIANTTSVEIQIPLLFQQRHVLLPLEAGCSTSRTGLALAGNLFLDTISWHQ
jgi:hypothetical protein